MQLSTGKPPSTSVPPGRAQLRSIWLSKVKLGRSLEADDG